jgi:hypothetical protein
MDKSTVEAISQVDIFLRNSMLLFDDLAATIREKTLRDNLSDLLPPERGYWINPGSSEGYGRFIFDHDGRFRFAYMLLKTGDSLLKGSASFKAICGQLDRDPVFPMILVAGTLEPRDPSQFRTTDGWYRKNAIHNTILLGGFSANTNLPAPAEYRMRSVIAFDLGVEVDARYCQKSRFQIWPLEEIPDSKVLGGVADQILAL